MSTKIRRGLTGDVPDDRPVLHLRECQNTACRVDTYLAVSGHVAMLSCPSCPVAGLPARPLLVDDLNDDRSPE